MEQLDLKQIQLKHLPRLWELIYKEATPEWKRWDAPYFPHQSMHYELFLMQREQWVGVPNRFGIFMANELIGIVTYYWEHEPSHWLEMGIVIYEGHNWGNGIGTVALKQWIAHLFSTMPLVRVGFTTWSGNERMMRVGEKLGMTMEARIRKVRYYEGQFYDSIRYGLLREEWEAIIKEEQV